MWVNVHLVHYTYTYQFVTYSVLCGVKCKLLISNSYVYRTSLSIACNDYLLDLWIGVFYFTPKNKMRSG